MPKIKTATENRQSRFKAEIKRNMELYDISTRKELGAKIGLREAAMSRRINDPEQFRPSELYKLFNVLHFTDEQILTLFRNRA